MNELYSRPEQGPSNIQKWTTLQDFGFVRAKDVDVDPTPDVWCF